MPGFDGTGPMGQGPRTGRGMGYCPPGPPRYVNPPRFFGGMGLAWRRGRGRGFGPGRGGLGGPGWGYRPFYPGAVLDPQYGYNPGPGIEDELAYLQDQAGMLKKDLDAINSRIEEIHAQQKEKASKPKE